jgi:hypothetical protein
MKTHRYWQFVEDHATGPDGHRYLLRAWGGSDVDDADAMAAAVVRLAEMHANVAARTLKNPAEYEYWTDTVREERLALLAGSDVAPEAVLTRNRYGSPVLNARYLFIADLDFAPPKPTLKFWAKPPDPADVAIAAVRAWAQANAATLRVYRTPAGLRLIRIDRSIDAESPSAMADLEALGSDKLYRALCRRQGCFRARLGPKPWRAGMDSPEDRFPRDAAAQGRFVEWLAQYEEARRNYAACRLVETIGAAAVAAELAALITTHDEMAGALSERPLA